MTRGAGGIVVLTPNASEKGGTNRVVATLVRNLLSGGQVKVVALEGGASAYPLPAQARFESLNPRAQTRAGRTVNTFLALPRLVRCLGVEKPRVVLSFLTRANLANVAAQSVMGRSFRSVICERNFNSLQYKAGPSGRAMLRLMKTMYPRADRVVANATELACDLHRTFGVAEHRIRVIHNPIDADEVREAASGPVSESCFGGDVPVVLSVGRLIEQKNHALLIRAFARLRARGPCRLVILGDGPLRDSLRGLARSLGLESDVEFLGWRDNPFKYARSATMFALTSNYEGFPNVLLEAMACGCPVVSTRCPSGPSEILEDGRSGFLVEVGDEQGVARAMERLLADDGLRRRMSEEGLRRVRDFGAAAMAAKFSEVFDSFDGRPMPQASTNPSRHAVCERL